MKSAIIRKFKIYIVVLLVMTNTFATNVFSSKKSEINDVYVTTKNVLTFERNTKSVMYEKNGYERVPMASTTKIMTAILAIEYGKLDEIVTVGKNAQNVIGWRLNLKQGDQIMLKDLLYATMLYSANDGAIAIAEHISGTVNDFSSLMNEKAKMIGANNTNFTSPHGLDNSNHYSTPYDLALIMDYALNLELFKNISKTHKYNLRINGYTKEINNTNKLLSKGFIGKTGYTGNALYCLVTNKVEKNLDIITVTLGSNTSKLRFSETEKLCNYCAKNYTIINFKDFITKSVKIKINKGKHKEILINPSIDKKTTIHNTDIANIKVEYDFPKLLNAPILQKSKIGTVIIRNNEELLVKHDFYAKKDYIKVTSLDYFKNIINNYIKLLEIS